VRKQTRSRSTFGTRTGLYGEQGTPSEIPLKEKSSQNHIIKEEVVRDSAAGPPCSNKRPKAVSEGEKTGFLNGGEIAIGIRGIRKAVSEQSFEGEGKEGNLVRSSRVLSTRIGHRGDHLARLNWGTLGRR